MGNLNQYERIINNETNNEIKNSACVCGSGGLRRPAGAGKRVVDSRRGERHHSLQRDPRDVVLHVSTRSMARWRRKLLVRFVTSMGQCVHVILPEIHHNLYIRLIHVSLLTLDAHIPLVLCSFSLVFYKSATTRGETRWVRICIAVTTGYPDIWNNLFLLNSVLYVCLSAVLLPCCLSAVSHHIDLKHVQ